MKCSRALTEVLTDDFIIHGQDIEQHDKNINCVLKRLSDKQLTVSAEGAHSE